MSNSKNTPDVQNIVDGVLVALERANIHIVQPTMIPNERGARLDLDNGAIVNIFTTGTVQVQGKNIDLVRELLRDYVNNYEACS